MITITEKKSGNKTYYERITESSSGIKETALITCQSVVVPRNGKEYYLIYDSGMKVCENAFRYVNIELDNGSPNSQMKAQEALKFLKCFEEIINQEVTSFSLNDVTNLKYFLHGFSPEGRDLVLHLSTSRSNSTVNGYLSVYRSYLKYLGVDITHPLFTEDRRSKIITPDPTEGERYKVKGYKSSEKSPVSLEVPHYISIDEFTRILKYVRQNHMIMAEIIIRLMFQCGLRIGEVLGLTADDVVEETNDDGRTVYIAYIRNRFSDRNDQRAKTCMKIVSRKQYESRDYRLKDYGYQFVVIPPDLYDLINDYIEEAHTKARANKSSYRRYQKYTIADRVRPVEEYDDDNYYIFINSIGTPISASSWNKELRSIFEATNIPLNKEVKKDGLNHRFRTGFAMFNVMYRHVRPIELADLLRHHGTAAVMCYYRPTKSDQITLKTDFENSMYEIVPELRRSEDD